jgi:translation initiation factor 2 subunit 1
MTTIESIDVMQNVCIDLSEQYNDVETNDQFKPNLICRMYENEYPEIGDIIIVKVTSINELGAYVNLLEYNNINGIIMKTELSRKRIKSINKFIRVNRVEIVNVINIDKERGYIDLSKKKILPEEIKNMQIKWNKTKTVALVMKDLAMLSKINIEELYELFCWSLYKQYTHAYNAFKLILTQPEILDEYFDLSTLDEKYNKIKELLIYVIKKRFTSKFIKFKSELEISCLSFRGIESIKEALSDGVSYFNEIVKSYDIKPELFINLKTPPIFIITINCNSTNQIEVSNLKNILISVIDVISNSIISKEGTLYISKLPDILIDLDILQENDIDSDENI